MDSNRHFDGQTKRAWHGLPVWIFIIAMTAGLSGWSCSSGDSGNSDRFVVELPTADSYPDRCPEKEIDPDDWVLYRGNYSQADREKPRCAEDSQCTRNEDCTEGINGVCIGKLSEDHWDFPDYPVNGCRCRYDECQETSDCPITATSTPHCRCANLVVVPSLITDCRDGDCEINTCVDGDCLTGEDCPETRVCMVEEDLRRYCATPDDECRSDRYCDEYKPHHLEPEYRWVCGYDLQYQCWSCMGR